MNATWHRLSVYVVVDVVLVVVCRCQALQHQRYDDTTPFGKW